MNPISPIVWVVLAVIVLIAIMYFYNQNKTAKLQAQTAAVVANTPPPCVPFSKAQQDAEKRDKQTKCATKALIPFFGQAYYFTCMKNIAVGLTPVNNC